MYFGWYQNKKVENAYRFDVLITNFESIRPDARFLNKVSPPIFNTRRYDVHLSISSPCI
jgi:hypothetical protein